ncbi:MAG: retroviral-like aspartic protease family protein [Ignavibacteriales bacterium]|nr:retroviral-like aspartic protease family protein [Ignavibacteriales bacterium]
MRFHLGFPLIINKVELTGKKGTVEIDLVLDTGAAFTCVSWKTLQAIGYDPTFVQTRQEIVTANGVIQVPKMFIEKIRIAEIEVSNIEILALDITEFSSARGLLGLNFLRYFRTVIDYRNGYLEIE